MRRSLAARRERADLARMESPAEAIQAMSRSRVERIGRRQFDEMVSEFYADDAVLMPSGQESVSGRDAILAYWNERPQLGLVSLSLFSESVHGSGDLAYELGKFTRTLRRRHGAPFQDTGKYVVIYRRVEGDRWRAVAEMFNADVRH